MSKDNKNKDELSLEEKRRQYELERQRAKQEREANRLKNDLRDDVSGRAKVPAGQQTVPATLSKFFGKSVLVIFIIIILIVAIIGSSLVGVIIGYIDTAREVPTSLLTIKEQTSYVYDKDGEQIAALTGTSNINRELVSFTEIEDTYIDEAFMAIEDRTFKTNAGIDPRRIMGAVINLVLSSGEVSYGGSTITQQVVKMLTGDNEVSYQRKVEEWYRAVKLTEQLSKAEIMNLYLNLVPMGNNYIGIQTAAKAYFNKDAKDLNLAECALLAGIPRSPASYNPKTELGRKNAQNRQRAVLQSMLEVGFITDQQFTDAINYELVYSDKGLSYTGQEVNSYYEEFTIKQVTEDLIKAGYPEAQARQMVQNGGLRIYTALDSDTQNHLDSMFKDKSNFQRYPAMFVNSPETPEAGLIILDNLNNTIVAMQGGYGEKRANLVLNRATDIHRQPGSSIKPLAVYGPAVELDLATGATIIKDEPVHMDIANPGKLWPRNVYLSYYGNMSTREALKISANVPAVKVLNEVGVDTAKNFLLEMGIDLRNDTTGLSLALGGLSYGLSPLQMGNAFTTFANGGLFAESKTYTKVLDSNGDLLLENKPQYEQVFSAESAYMMEKLMQEAFHGPNQASRFTGTFHYRLNPLRNANGEEIATSGKTGTSDDNIDKWSIIQTPYYTASGWFGFDNRIKRTEIAHIDAYNIHQMTFDILEYMHRDTPGTDWEQPAGIVELRVNRATGYQSNNGYIEYFKSDSPITPTSTRGSDGETYNYIRTDRIPGYYENFAENNGYR